MHQGSCGERPLVDVDGQATTRSNELRNAVELTAAVGRLAAMCGCLVRHAMMKGVGWDQDPEVGKSRATVMLLD